ncbi:hypothetical protein FCI23_42340 [Actinacidiphila oryziradicis]|uniref:Uncharacterized protein n=1 Tax=Actinacidiphila oryziradicis TaxID=2571141 RepID=A0A4U0RWG3_9ACTN|nr:hypothetical protein FCI23_42340 [Actinacidiphila oryziradicis]
MTVFNDSPGHAFRARELHELLELPTDEASVNITRNRPGTGRRASPGCSAGHVARGPGRRRCSTPARGVERSRRPRPSAPLRPRAPQSRQSPALDRAADPGRTEGTGQAAGVLLAPAGAEAAGPARVDAVPPSGSAVVGAVQHPRGTAAARADSPLPGPVPAGGAGASEPASCTAGTRRSHLGAGRARRSGRGRWSGRADASHGTPRTSGRSAEASPRRSSPGRTPDARLTNRGNSHGT